MQLAVGTEVHILASCRHSCYLLWKRYLDLWPCSEPEREHLERLLSPTTSDPTAALLAALPAVPLEVRSRLCPLYAYLSHASL